MARSVEEWVGTSDDAAIPPRVKVRVFQKHGGRCANCSLVIVGHLTPEYDHIQAIINGGANRESNIQLLCSECHKLKSKSDVKEKSFVYRRKVKRLKLKKTRKIPGSKGSGFRRKMDGTVIRER